MEKNQPIVLSGAVAACSGYDTPWALRDGTVCSEEVVHGGYKEVFRFIKLRPDAAAGLLSRTLGDALQQLPRPGSVHLQQGQR